DQTASRVRTSLLGPRFGENEAYHTQDELVIHQRSIGECYPLADFSVNYDVFKEQHEQALLGLAHMLGVDDGQGPE
ncbi:hypothetical protein LCGC14_2716800, partial [marine sediment metagenome]